MARILGGPLGWYYELILVPLGIALLFIILFPVIKAIVQLVVNRSQISVDSASISQAQNGRYLQVTHTGIFSARIHFQETVDVAWVEDDAGTVTHLGNMTIDTLFAKGKRASLNTTGPFQIAGDGTDFGRFVAHMITAQNFTWRLSSKNLRVQALKFPEAQGINFNKDITLSGLNNFDNMITLKDFQLPSDNPAGGINFVAVTELSNPSPFSLNLGTVVFALSYQNVSLGMGSSQWNELYYSFWTLQPHTSPSDLAVVSQLFTNYLNSNVSNVTATGVSTLQPDNSITQLVIPFKPFSPIDPIRTITIGELGLAFTPDSPWAPNASSNSVQASLELPFGFKLEIGEIQNDFNITKDGNAVAGLSTPLGASTSSVSVLSSTDTVGTINITIANTNLNVMDSEHSMFSTFNANLTSMNATDFRLIGRSRTVANTSLGQITLDPILVNVSTSLNGLQGLKGMTEIKTVDVQGGTEDAITLAIDVSIFNPSNLNLNTGDLTLQLFRDGAILGTALLPNLTLNMGNNTVRANSSFEANKTPQGLQTLNEFVGKKDVQLSIAGFNGSTEIASLAEAFETLNINVILPGLTTNLLDTAALKGLWSAGDNISHVTVRLANPFSAGLHITKISSTVKSFGIALGSINTTTDFMATPKSTTTSPDLDLNMNFDPAALFTVTRALAVEAGLDVSPLDGIVQIGDINYLSVTGPPLSTQHQASAFRGFDLPSFVQSAFKKLQSDVELSTDVTIGDYKTTIQYTQTGVPTATDDSLNFILPVLAQPIVQKIITGSALGIDTVLIMNPQQNSFGTKLQGSISSAGPFDANIAFPQGLSVMWSGKALGTIKLDTVKVIGDVGATLDLESDFVVADVDHLTAFTKVLLTEESFEWVISGENLTGIDVSGVSLNSKTVTLKGFNGLKDGVQIKTFDLPSNDPAGGIHLTLEASTTNPSQVGVQLSSIGFETFVGDIMIAPVLSSEGVTLSPGSTSPLSLVGRLVPQDSTAGLSAVSDVFNNFVHGKDSDVVVVGASAGPSDVTWLNEGIKALRIATSTAFSPSTSSKSTDAAFTLPFAFPIDISALEQTITVGFEGTSFAQLAIPKSPSQTDVENRIIHLTFDHVPFAVFGDQHSVFDQFVAATTVGQEQTLSLSDIGFSVESSIAGLQGLNTKPVTISNLDVNHGFPDFLLIKVDSSLFNPSNLIITPGNASYPIGGAVSAGRTLLQNFLQGVDVDTTISGNTDSTPIDTALIFPVDIVQKGIASATFTLANPFTASINLLQVGATATFHNLTLGTIDNVDVSSNPIHADGHSSVTSQPLPLHFNLDPLVIIQLLTVTASENGVSLGPLSQLFQIVLDNPDFHPPITSTVDTQPATRAILKSLAGLKIDLAVEIATDLAFDQKGVPAVTDKTSLFLIGAVAAPITQRLVDGSILAFNEANITVTWEGHDIAQITLPPVCAAANAGVPDYRTNAHLTITDLDQFTAFAIFLLHNPSFEWTITSPKLRVSALGTIFDNVSLSKQITFKAFNGLPGVTISNFQLPSDDPAGGIHIETDALIPSPSQLGIDLGTVGFQSFFQDTLVGRALSGTGLFLAPNSETRTHLSGRIVPQSGKDLENIGILFSNFLAGKNQSLTTKGDFDEAFAPPAGSNFTLAKYKNPFGFALQVIEAGQTLVLNSQGVDAAQLVLPKIPAIGGVSTGNVADLVISFHDQPLKSLNNAAFQTLFADVTLNKAANVGLKGTADVTARTSIGDVAISGIPFNVQSSLQGINAFGSVASLSNISVTGSGGAGGAEFIVSPLTTTLQNPSNITLDTVDIALPVIFNGVKIGRAAINPFDLIPGENVVATEFHYEPDNANDTIAQVFNPLDADLVLEFVQSDAGVNGEVFAQFGQAFDNFVVPPGQTVNSGDFPNVLLTQGAIASLDIIPLGILDVFSASTVRVGQGGYQIPWLKLAQSSVPTTYNLVLDSAAVAKAKQNSTSSNSTESRSSSGTVSASGVISHLSSLVSASAAVTSHAQESTPNGGTAPASPKPTTAPPKSTQAAHESPIAKSTDGSSATTSQKIVSAAPKLVTAVVSPPDAVPTVHLFPSLLTLNPHFHVQTSAAHPQSSSS
ncbi:hypothetical protein BD779DRAFT_1661547 [Infundibulicybe gibba]|nr:hypothetical protein BD779DRAFT_1661547 [Infundibulicybe gibba]